MAYGIFNSERSKRSLRYSLSQNQKQTFFKLLLQLFFHEVSMSCPGPLSWSAVSEANLTAYFLSNSQRPSEGQSGCCSFFSNVFYSPMSPYRNKQLSGETRLPFTRDAHRPTRPRWHDQWTRQKQNQERQSWKRMKGKKEEKLLLFSQLEKRRRM